MLATLITIMMICLGFTSESIAEAPWHSKHPWPWSRYEGSRRVDVIGPIGNRLPQSYRRTYNRPSYLGGKIAAKIEPSSQEAMAFHNAQDLGLYDNNGLKGAVTCKHCPPQRVEQHYFYPKPWEVLTVGPRQDVLKRSEQVGESDAIDSQRSKQDFESPQELNSAEKAEMEKLPEAADVFMELPAPTGESE
jgi:hypothetical protein